MLIGIIIYKAHVTLLIVSKEDDNTLDHVAMIQNNINVAAANKFNPTIIMCRRFALSISLILWDVQVVSKDLIFCVIQNLHYVT